LLVVNHTLPSELRVIAYQNKRVILATLEQMGRKVVPLMPSSAKFAPDRPAVAALLG
jgi:hypothetical protein